MSAERICDLCEGQSRGVADIGEHTNDSTDASTGTTVTTAISIARAKLNKEYKGRELRITHSSTEQRTLGVEPH